MTSNENTNFNGAEELAALVREFDMFMRKGAANAEMLFTIGKSLLSPSSPINYF